MDIFTSSAQRWDHMPPSYRSTRKDSVDSLWLGARVDRSSASGSPTDGDAYRHVTLLPLAFMLQPASGGGKVPLAHGPSVAVGSRWISTDSGSRLPSTG